MKRKTTEEFIKDAQGVHGNVYDYSATDYQNSNTKVKVRCLSHGIFEVRPSDHLRIQKNGKAASCAKCVREMMHRRFIGTKKEFVEKAIAIHGNLYGYDEVEYVNYKVRVKIRCFMHGIFEQTPFQHLKPSSGGCSKCNNGEKYSRRKVITTEEIVSKFIGVHGDLYGYDEVEYVNSRTLVRIQCPIHGIFKQRIHSHLNGAGCRQCKNSPPSLNQKDFLTRAFTKHGDRYDYSETVYIKMLGKVKIICGVHGEFWQYAGHHLKGMNCPQCASLDTIKIITLTTDDWKRKAKVVHGDLYGYDEVEYVDSRLEVKILCYKHGIFLQNAAKHLEGSGCARCFGRYKTTKEYIKQAQGVHGPFYDYSVTIYVNTQGKIKIRCPIHGIFEQNPSGHLVGRGCRVCHNGGFNDEYPGMLYYLRVADGSDGYCYKIGITNRTVQTRFSQFELKHINVLWTKLYHKGIDARMEERRILNKFTQYRTVGKIPTLLSGHSELFTENVLRDIVV